MNAPPVNFLQEYVFVTHTVGNFLRAQNEKGISENIKSCGGIL
jgi:hypothetical protein